MDSLTVIENMDHDNIVSIKNKGLNFVKIKAT